MKRILGFLLFIQTASAAPVPEVVEIEIRDHLFYPDTIRVRAGTPVVLQVRNVDPSAEEFQSLSLNFERIIGGGQSTLIHIMPLPPGRYEFVGEFHPQTAVGQIIAH